jgi:hypothetical protein
LTGLPVAARLRVAGVLVGLTVSAGLCALTALTVLAKCAVLAVSAWLAVSAHAWHGPGLAARFLLGPPEGERVLVTVRAEGRRVA